MLKRTYLILCSILWNFLYTNLDAQTIGFTNSGHAGASFEACPNDQIVLALANWGFTPTKVKFTNALGSLTTVNGGGLTVQATSCSPNYCGNLTLNIPVNAITGQVYIEDNIGSSLSFTMQIVNPSVNISATPPDMCSQETLALSGTPSGGIWDLNDGAGTSYSPSFMPAAPTGWSADKILVPAGIGTTNQTNAVIQYTYTPHFQTAPAETCPAITISRPITIINNDFSGITFQSIPVTTDSIRIPILINSTTPSALPAGTGTDTSYFGGFVASDTFLPSQAGVGTHSVAVTVHNNGCDATAVGTIDVNPSPPISGLPTNMCRLDAPITIHRDGSHPRSVQVITHPFFGIVSVETYYRNNTFEVTSTRGGISTLNSTPGSEVYLFNPNNVVGNVDTVTAIYRENYSLYWQTSSGRLLLDTASYEVAHTVQIVTIENKIPPVIDPTFQFGHCENNTNIVLNSTPSGGIYRIRYLGGTRAGQDTTLSGNFFNPQPLHSIDNTDIDYRLTYIAGTGNCRDSTITFFRIEEPIIPVFVGRHNSSTPVNTYCSNENDDALTPSPLPTAGTSGIFTGGGIISPIGIFSPDSASAGNNTITYTFTSSFGCISSISKTFVVNLAPTVILSSPKPNNEYCANLDSVGLIGSPTGGLYSGSTIINSNFFYPPTVFGGASGQTIYRYDYQNPTTGCSNYDTLLVTIRPVSVTNLIGFPSDSQFCQHEAPITINTSSTFQDTGYYIGHGFIPNTNIYVPDSIVGHLDTVKYVHTNIFGCVDTTKRIIRVDTLPIPIITNLPTPLAGAVPHWCIDHDTVWLSGTPSFAQAQNVSFSGLGVRRYVSGSTGVPDTFVFAPANAGTGFKTITYTVQDNHGCVGSSTSTVYVAPLPVANLAGLAPQYCVDAPDPTLSISNHIPSRTTIGFWGNGTGGTPASPNTSGLLDISVAFAATPSNPKLVYYKLIDTFGCVDIDSQTYFINPLPNVSILGAAEGYCANGSIATIIGSPSGGATGSGFGGFTGFGGTSPTSFNPAAVPANVPLTMQYVYIDPNTGCKDTARFNTQVYDAPNANLTGLNTQYCEQNLSFTLTGNPAGGTFSGNGVTGSSFSPFRAGSGTHHIVYTAYLTHTLPSSSNLICSAFDQDTTIVRPLPVLNINQPLAGQNFCTQDVPVRILGSTSGVTPLMDTVFHGTGVFDSLTTRIVVIPPFGNVTVADTLFMFKPNIANIGTNTVVMIGRDTFGCVDSTTITYNVYQTPTPTFNVNSSFCEGTPQMVLVGNPTTGSFSLNSVALPGGLYNPSPGYPTTIMTAPRVDTIVYSVTNGGICTNTQTHLVTVNPLPRPVFTNLPTILAGTVPHYCINASAVTLTSSPSLTAGQTRTFSGAGVTQPSVGVFRFTPNDAGTGFKTLICSVTSAAGCIGTEDTTIYIAPLPVAPLGGLSLQYCQDAINDTLTRTGYIAGRTQAGFWGDGMSGSISTPDTTGILSIANAFTSTGIGAKHVYYRFQDTFGCVSTDVQTYFINPLPSMQLLGVQAGYCTNSNNAIFTGFPAGGTYNPLGGLSPSGGGLATFFPNVATPNTPLTIRYSYTEPSTGCSNFTTATTQIYTPPTVDMSGLPAQRCELNDTIPLAGTPAGGTFSGSGVSGNNFYPIRAGSGTHYVVYTASTSYLGGTLLCSNSDQDTIVVSPLPVPTILQPANNAAFCTADAPIRLLGTSNNLSVVLDTIFAGTGIVDSLTSHVVFIPPFGNVTVSDTVFYFSPAAAGAGTHHITFTVVNNTGCSDVVENTYIVYQTPSPGLAVSPTYCESDTNVILIGAPAGGLYFANGDTLQNGLYDPNPLFPNVLLNGSKIDTLVYQFTTGGLCVGVDTQYTLVNPIPHLSYIGVNLNGDTTNQSCIGQDTINLIPNIAGGSFLGSGVLFGGSQFLPNISGVGQHSIAYEYTEPSTGCSNVYRDTFFAYNMPVVDFEAIGGCGDAVILMQPNNGVLNLNGLFAGNLYDSITTIRWNLDDANISTVSPSANNTINTLGHYYANAGVYHVSLFVENRGFCSDSDTLRVVVSPKQTPTPLLPYSENFEANDGQWFDEAEDSMSASHLWSWQVANGTHINTTANAHHSVWTTSSNGAYGVNASGWVYSPCFDLTQLDRPMIALDFFNNTDEGNDGVVIEYFDTIVQAWQPLGQVHHGITWYDHSVVAGRPGIQDLAPIGWSGETNAWQNARYKLDDFHNYHNFRMRVAFGAVGVHNRGLEGFAFDNVWIGNRTRNILLEHFSNIGYSGMDGVNQHVYNLVFGTNLVRDVILAQYNMNAPSTDEFCNDNPDDANTRTYFYGLSTPARAVIDGNGRSGNSSLSQQLNPDMFEVEMLQTPKFTLTVDTFTINGNDVAAKVRVKANEAMPYDKYIVQIAVLEDSLTYTGTVTKVNSVVREMMPDPAGTLFQQAWAAGDEVVVDAAWTLNPSRNNAQNLELASFIQNDATAQVYQAVWSRDLTRFINALGTTPEPSVVAQANEVQSAKLFPNPTNHYFNVQFDQALSNEYAWKLVDMHGVTVRDGLLPSGTIQLKVSNLDLASGMYIFVIHTNQFYVQRKVVIMDGN